MSAFVVAHSAAPPKATDPRAKTTAAGAPSRPAGSGRRAVRAIRASWSRSRTWLRAAAPLPVSAVPSMSPRSCVHAIAPGTASTYPDAAMTTTNAVIPGFDNSL